VGNSEEVSPASAIGIVSAMTYAPPIHALESFLIAGRQMIRPGIYRRFLHARFSACVANGEKLKTGNEHARQINRVNCCPDRLACSRLNCEKRIVDTSYRLGNLQSRYNQALPVNDLVSTGMQDTASPDRP
jgi:hypothetical protein